MNNLLKTLMIAASATLLFAVPAKAATYWATSVYADPGTRTDGNDNDAGRDKSIECAWRA